MCGRYALSANREQLQEFFLFPLVGEDLPAPRTNIPPTTQVPIVRYRDGEHQLVTSRWGLIPSWAKEEKLGSRMFNARVETVSEKPSFRSAWRKQRCLVPANGWYEWQKDASGKKQPYYMSRADGQLLAFAGLWEWWSGGTQSGVVSNTILTTDAVGKFAQVHDRMPVLLSRELWPMWLGVDEPSGSDTRADAEEVIRAALSESAMTEHDRDMEIVAKKP